MGKESFRLLINGIDTLQCAYYLVPKDEDSAIDFEYLTKIREAIRNSKIKEPLPVELGNKELLLEPYGTSSGYPLVLKDENFKIEMGEFNWPNFYVTFKSEALWRESALDLHNKFLNWADSAGYRLLNNEKLSRVDFAFDYYVPEIDFKEDHFITRSTKDSTFRENKKVQTFKFGNGDIVLRIYDKIAEIIQKSEKVWFFSLWDTDENVWRIEWQIRKGWLKKFGIITFKDLEERQGDILRYMATEHDSLRIPNGDNNPSRWPLHPLWEDLIQKINELNHLGIYRDYGNEEILREREVRIGISVYGYLKRIAALNCMSEEKNYMAFTEALNKLDDLLKFIHDPLTWNDEIKSRVKKMQLGEWK